MFRRCATGLPTVFVPVDLFNVFGSLDLGIGSVVSQADDLGGKYRGAFDRLLAMRAEDFLSLVNGRRGHFRYESGYHSDRWLDLETLFQQPERVRPLVLELCATVNEMEPDVICGPLIEGGFVALLAALEMRKAFVYTTRLDTGEAHIFSVSYQLPPVLQQAVAGNRVAIVNDVISAGSAVRGTLHSLRTAGAEVVGVAALAVLGDSFLKFAEQERLLVKALVTMENNMWEQEACPLCRDGVPLQELADH